MRLRGRETRSGLGRIQEPEIVGFRIARSRDTRRAGAVRLSRGYEEAVSFQGRFVGGGREREKVSVFLRGRPGRKRQQVGRWPEHRLEGGSFLDGGGQPTEGRLAAGAAPTRPGGQRRV